MAAYCRLQCSKNSLIGNPDHEKGRRVSSGLEAREKAVVAVMAGTSPAMTKSAPLFCFRRLFGGLLPGRIERAGIVDLGDLMIAEAEHLPQDFIGVFAEQRRAQN